jgi:hypothetical protein
MSEDKIQRKHTAEIKSSCHLMMVVEVQEENNQTRSNGTKQKMWQRYKDSATVPPQPQIHYVSRILRFISVYGQL